MRYIIPTRLAFFWLVNRLRPRTVFGSNLLTWHIFNVAQILNLCRESLILFRRGLGDQAMEDGGRQTFSTGSLITHRNISNTSSLPPSLSISLSRCLLIHAQFQVRNNNGRYMIHIDSGDVWLLGKEAETHTHLYYICIHVYGCVLSVFLSVSGFRGGEDGCGEAGYIWVRLGVVIERWRLEEDFLLPDIWL